MVMIVDWPIGHSVYNNKDHAHSMCTYINTVA